MAKYNVLDLFCGAGGLSLGFQLAGFNIIGGVDNKVKSKNSTNTIYIKGTVLFGGIEINERDK